MKERVLSVLVSGMLSFAAVGEALDAQLLEGSGVGSFQEPTPPPEPKGTHPPEQEVRQSSWRTLLLR